MWRTIIYGFLVLQVAVGFSCGSEQTPGLHVAGASCAARLQWAVGVGGTGDDRVQAVAALPDGSVVVAASFERSVILGEGADAVSLSSAGGADSVLARFDERGRLRWARRAGGALADRINGVALYPDGDVLIAGHFEGSALVDGGGESTVSLDSAGGSDVLLARYDARGSLRWARRAGGKGADRALAVATLPDGSALVAGEFSEQATFGAGGGTQVDLLTTGGSDGFVARYDAAGALVWARQLTGSLAATVRGVAATSDGAALVTGDAAKETAGAERALFVARFEGDGTRAWQSHTSGAGSARGEAVTVLPDGALAVGGAFSGSVVVGGPTGTTLTAAGERDILVARFGPGGELGWARRAGGSGDDAATALAAVPTGAVVVAGRFSGTALFGAGEAGAATLASAGGSDMFVALLDAQGRLCWVRRAGGERDDAALALAPLPLGSVVVVGYHGGAATFGPGEAGERTLPGAGGADGFVVRLGP